MERKVDWLRNYSVSSKERFLPFFHTFLLITHEPFDISEIWWFHMKERDKFYQNHSRFHLKNKSIGKKMLFLVTMTDFVMTLLKNRAKRVLYGWFKLFKLEYQFSTMKWRLIVPGLISLRSIFTKIPGVQNSLWNTTAPPYLTCKNTIAAEHDAAVPACLVCRNIMAQVKPPKESCSTFFFRP